MSKIKTLLVNPIQEKTEALGYASIGEAMVDGWDSAEVLSMVVDDE